ncbi:DnaD domain-containing protein [Halalkalibacter urbisdiaboli]|uniref:DnaD domain-containing protein n=1 Tax=Halalkalibacter urbisdiaboli TaxID=1960589 RepID=UPI000B451199|nr:DnaD domain-containing protein [Halalkalibacter urbisdiaboli]
MDQKSLVKWTTQGHLSVPKLLLQHYKSIGLKEDELVALLQVQTFIDEGEQFPTPDRLSERMTHTTSGCAELLGRLVKKGYLTLEKQMDDQGILFEFYTLEPLWIRLLQHIQGEEQTNQEQLKFEQEGQLYTRFEQEFCRPLSPIEAETLSMWIDQDNHSPELILGALREAVVSGKLNFRYIDRILFEWKRNGVTTLEQAKAHGEKFRKYNQTRKPEPERQRSDAFPGFNWLEQS